MSHSTQQREYPILFWPRAAAVLVDSLVVTAVHMVLLTIGFGVAVLLGNVLGDHAAGFGMLALILLSTLGLPLVAFIYYVVFTARGATPGKKVFGLRIQRKDRSNPGYGAAVGRVLVMGIAGPFSLIGLLHGDRRAYHDLLTNLHVAKT